MDYRKLRRVHPVGLEPLAEVRVGFERVEGRFVAEFQVLTPSVHVNPSLPAGQSQWGLWDWDVVEIFLSASGAESGLPYLEVQISPLGQHVELLIHEPRKRWDAGFRSGFRPKLLHQHDGRLWRARMEIPLERLGWSGRVEDLRGGAFAILGAPERREYFGLFLPEQQTPDFHRPEFFRPFFSA